MRTRILFIATVCFPLQVFAQQINGMVLDQTTKKPIMNAKIAASSSLTFTAANGSFNLKMRPLLPDTITVSHSGYETRFIAITRNTELDTLVVLLNAKSILLQDVTITGRRNPQEDSLKHRQDFDAAFSYEKPAFNDHFITKSPTPNPRYTPFQNATSSVVSLDILAAIGWFSRNKTPIAKLQKRALAEEEFTYVDRIFSKEKIRSVTTLEGDSLQDFINRYRPDREGMKAMNDYQLLLYIKKCYEDFKNTDQQDKLPSPIQ